MLGIWEKLGGTQYSGCKPQCLVCRKQDPTRLHRRLRSLCACRELLLPARARGELALVWAYEGALRLDRKSWQ